MQNTLAVFGPLGWPEIVVILAIFILLFGAKKLPELARGVGKSIKEFKKATSGVEEDIRSAMNEEPAPAKKIEKKPNAEAATPEKTAAKENMS